MEIKRELWAKSQEGKEIYKYTLINEAGAKVVLSDLGAAVVSVIIPDREGKMEDVALGYDDALSYLADGPCAGKCPGRYANRIAKGNFTLEGVEYKLEINNGPNHLHGGSFGFQNKVWESRIKGDAVEFMYFSEDGESGYPGNLKIYARYTWSEENELKLIFSAKTDKTTIINLTNHSYFNLKGFGKGDVLDHELKINAAEYLPTDDTLIPLGESEPVAGTPMDFVDFHKIGERIKADFLALNYGKGYDNCFIVDGYMPGQLQLVAELQHKGVGRKLSMYSTQPGVQIYTGNWLSGCPTGKGGVVYEDYDAVAIECQHFPDSPNKPEFPSTILREGEEYNEAIIWAFSTI